LRRFANCEDDDVGFSVIRSAEAVWEERPNNEGVVR
jgi:hypothetical protein